MSCIMSLNVMLQVRVPHTVRPVLSKRPRETLKHLLMTGACLIEMWSIKFTPLIAASVNIISNANG